MIKKAISLIVSVIVLVLCISPAVADEIKFLDLEWLSSQDEVIKVVQAAFPEADKKHYEEAPSLMWERSFNFCDGVVFPDRYETDAIKTVWIEFTSSDYKNKMKVAGWNVFKISAKFIEYPKRSSCKLFSAEYYFDLNDEGVMTVEEQYDDIFTKLSSKYGTPYVYNREQLLNDGDKCAVWKGDNETGLILKLQFGNSIWLNYGTTAVNDFFKEGMKTAEKEKEQLKKEQEQKIKIDSFGL